MIAQVKRAYAGYFRASQNFTPVGVRTGATCPFAVGMPVIGSIANTAIVCVS